MIRQRFLFTVFALTIGVTLMTSSVYADAATSFSPFDTFRSSTKGIHSITRTDLLYNLSYTGTSVVDGKSVSLTFANISGAVDWAKTKVNSEVINNRTGQVVFSNISQPYAVYAISAGSETGSSANAYSTMADAISAAGKLANAYVVNLKTGSLVWSNIQGNYAVSSKTSTTMFQALPDALIAASSLPGGNVIDEASGQTVWQSVYQVVINGQFSKSFATLVDAKAYAEQSPQSEVIDNTTGKDIWDNIPRYDVYQNGILIKQFSYESDALAFVQGLSNVTVVNIATKQTVYTNVPNFVVEVGTKVIESFATESSAIALAKTLPGAVVIELNTNQVVWSSVGLYGVYRYSQLVRSFSNEQSALTFAKTLDHVQVINTQTNQVVYSNYPAIITSPNGDTFTVQSGMLIDHWGKLNITWAPAPSFMIPGQTYVTEDYIHWYDVKQAGDAYVGQWENPYRTLNLMTPSNLTAAQINTFIATNAVSSSVLQNTGSYFIEAQQTYGVNAQYLVAHAIIESGWGTSYFAKNRDNLFGYEAYTSNPNAAHTFRSIEYDINFQAWFVRNEYLNSNGSFFNGSNLDGMNVDYATDPIWSNSIARIMSEITPYSLTIANQPLLKEQSVPMVFPYPKGAMGAATSNITVYSGTADASTPPRTVGSIPSGTIFPVLGNSPGWDEVKLANNQTGFVNWNQVSLQNIVEVWGINYGNTLNVVSSTSSTSSPVLDKLTNGTYLVLVNNPGNGWDYIVDGNGKSGWVNSQYVKVIH